MTRPLIQLAEVALGRQRSPEHERGDHVVPYLRSANVVDGALDLSDVKEMNFTPQEQVVFALRHGDVLVTEGSGSRETVGTSAVWRDELPSPVCFQNTLLRLRPRPGLADGRYLAWWARHAHAAGLMAATATGANILHLSAEALRRLPIPDLDLIEQRKIADFLDDQVARIDNIIAARNEHLSLLSDAEQSARAGAMSGKSSAPSRHPLLGPIEPAWPIRRLRDVVRRVGVGVVVNPSSYFVDDGVPFLHGGNVREGHVDLTNVKLISAQDSNALWRSRLDEGDVVVVRAGYPGRAAVVPRDLAGANCASVLLIKPSPSALSEWIELFFNSPQGRSQVSLAQYGAAQEQINVGDVVDFLLPAPPLEIQAAQLAQFNVRRENLQDVQSAIRNQLLKLEEFKRSLITAAVTGEFDVSAADGSRVVA